MTINVQRIPRGLLQLINAVSSGTNPVGMADEIAGVVQMEQFYAHSQFVHFSNGAGPVADPIATITVPQTQWWLLLRATSECFPAGAEPYMAFQIMMRGGTGSPAAERFTLATYEQDRVAVAGQTTNSRIVYQPAGGIQVIPPGTIFESRRLLGWVPAGNLSITLQLHVGVLG